MTLKTEGMNEDWPLEVTMQDGTRTSVTTEPGSIVLYESAKIVHGRPKIYNGTYYYACFAHYRPRNWGGGKWTDYANTANQVIQKNMALCRESQLDPSGVQPQRGG